MLGKILGIIFLILIGIFALCSCKVASLSDQEMEEYFFDIVVPMEEQRHIEQLLLIVGILQLCLSEDTINHQLRNN